MPFVLNVGERWIKNNDSDFYVDFAKEEKHVQKVPLPPSWSSEKIFQLGLSPPRYLNLNCSI